jgi:hypothetical protein
MKHLFIPYRLALIAKEKGFNDSCFGGYYLFENKPDLCIYQDENEFSDSKEIILQAPLYQQIVDWFREKHKIFIMLDCTNTKYPNGNWECEIHSNNDKKYGHFGFENYYEALNKSIEEALKLI